MLCGVRRVGGVRRVVWRWLHERASVTRKALHTLARRLAPASGVPAIPAPRQFSALVAVSVPQ